MYVIYLYKVTPKYDVRFPKHSLQTRNFRLERLGGSPRDAQLQNDPTTTQLWFSGAKPNAPVPNVDGYVEIYIQPEECSRKERDNSWLG